MALEQNDIKQRHRVGGILSFLLSLVASLLTTVALTPVDGADSIGLAASGFLFILSWVVAVAAILLGISSIQKTDSKKVFPILGVVISAVTVASPFALKAFDSI
jgi:hypothetical protein